MPELPEVETIRRGIEPHVVGRRIERVLVRDRRLRWPIIRGFERKLAGRAIGAVDRRGKYLLLDLGPAAAGAPRPDRVILRGTRMPILKFPRHPGGVTEAVSEPFDEP